MCNLLTDRLQTLLRACTLFMLAIATSAWAQAPMKCDVNGDRVIDLTDIQLIIAARGQVATGASDPRDANNNKVIDEFDARICTQRCTRAACSTQNSPPHANAGPDQSVPVGATVHLSGALSTDSDGPNPLTYAWTMVASPAGSAAALINATAVNPDFVVDAAGTYRIRLVASDGIASSAPDEVVVSTQNSAPTANAGPDQTRRVGDTAVLNGAASSDPDGNPLTYVWTLLGRPKGSAAAIVRDSQVTPNLVLDQQGTYIAQLVVNDGLVNSAPDTVVITTGNTPPVANAGPDQSVFIGDLVTLNGSSSTDVDGDPLTYAWTLTGKPAGSAAVLANAGTASPSFAVDKAGSYTAQLVVNDGTSNSAPDVVVVATGNTAPVANPKASCAASANTDCSVPIGTLVGLDASASTDVDGNPLTYAWSLLTRPAGSSAVLTTSTAVNAAFTTDAPGAFVVQLIVNDGTVNSNPKTLTLTSTNVKPTAVATMTPSSIPAVPQLMQLDGSGSTDPENQGLTYAWSLIAKPSGSTAVLSSATAAKPTFNADLLGTYTAQLIVSDGFLPSNPVTASASTANQAPTANAGPDQTLVAGSTVQLTSAGSSDPEGAPLGFFWSMLAKPAGSTTDFNNANAANPTFVADKKGTYVAQLIVNDSVLSSAPDTVQVTATNRAPVAVADAYTIAEDGTLVIGAAAGVLGNDTDADGDALTAIIVGATPAGLAFNANGGFTYTPPANFNGTTTFQYKANDGVVDSNTATVTITVTPVNDPPIANAGPNQNLSVPGLVQLNGAASSDPEGQPLTYAWTLTAIPTGSAATLSNAAIVNPTFTADLGGTYTAQLIVSDGALPSAPSTVTITVPALPTVTIVATKPNAAETGLVPGEFTFTRSGPTAVALTVSFSIGGTAVNGSDYQAISGSVTIPAGQASTTLTITPLADAVIEPDETVILTLIANPTVYLIGSPSSATVTIADGVPNTVTIVATTPNAAETGLVPGVFTFTRTGPTTFALTVSFCHRRYSRQRQRLPGDQRFGDDSRRTGQHDADHHAAGRRGDRAGRDGDADAAARIRPCISSARRTAPP